VGLIGDAAWADYLAKQERAQKLGALLEKTRVSGEMLEKIEKAQQERLAAQSAPRPLADEDETAGPAPEKANDNALSSARGSTLAQLLRRPEIVIEDLAPVVRESYPEFFAQIEIFSNSEMQNSPRRHGDTEKDKLSAAARNEMKTVETEIKYAGYLDQQKKSIERLKKAEQRVIPEWFDYGKVSGLSREMNEKLQHVRPRTLGQASRIPGVTPAAVSLINVYIEIQGKRNNSPLMTQMNTDLR
jgi:tRNA uridine 5-carboxymethylaminomethyl modification enzyme